MATESPAPPKYDENIPGIDYNVQPEAPPASLVSPPILAVAQAVHETQENDATPSLPPTMESARLDDQDPSSYSETITHAHNIISHTQNEEENHNMGHPLEDHSHLSRNVYDRLNVHDVLPLEIARVRLLNLIVDHFIEYHIVPVTGESLEKLNEKTKKRRINDVGLHLAENSLQEMPKIAYGGDPNYVLPLLFVVNAYETLVAEVNSRISEIEGLQGKSIGLALEAAGGLYRRLIEKYPKSGSLTSFKRREMASAEEARKRFPQLVGSDEKRVRFIVVHGLDLVEKPSTIAAEDAEWFRRVTGRPEARLYPTDYKFFSQRTKSRRSSVNSSPPQPALMDVLQLNSSMHSFQTPPTNSRVRSEDRSRSRSRSRSPSESQGQARYAPPHSMTQALGLTRSQSQTPQPRQQPQQLGVQQHHDVNSTPPHHTHHLDMMSQLALVQQSTNRLPGIAKFCDECGAQYVRDASKFCSECGTRRFGV